MAPAHPDRQQGLRGSRQSHGDWGHHLATLADRGRIQYEEGGRRALQHAGRPQLPHSGLGSAARLWGDVAPVGHDGGAAATARRDGRDAGYDGATAVTPPPRPPYGPTRWRNVASVAATSASVA